MATQEEIDLWTSTIHEIMTRDGVSEDEANANLINLLLSPEVQAKITELSAVEEAQRKDNELWTSVITDLQARFPEWTEAECNQNLTNLIQSVLDKEQA